MAIIYPVDCDSPRRRIEFCHSMIAKMRKLHNFMGKWTKGELTQVQYDKLPTVIKTNYSFITYPVLPQSLFDDFKATYFAPKEKKIIDKLHENKALLEISAVWTQDMDEI